MSPPARVLRYAAFADAAGGGNPAGVVLDATALDDGEMQAIAAEVGYSETAFLVPGPGRREYDVRYFSPITEVPFCGHATIAAGVALAERDGPGPVLLHSPAGDVPVEVSMPAGGLARATLTSPPPSVDEVGPALLDVFLDALRWRARDLDPALPPRVAEAGARHLIVAARTRGRLAELDYDFDALAAAMRSLGLITVALIWREEATLFHTRNAGASIGVVEDPATGAAAAALGGYLVSLGKLSPPAGITVLQGADMGRPSRLTVEVESVGDGVRVSGSAVALASPQRG